VDTSLPTTPQGPTSERAQKARETYRALASTLNALADTIRFYRFWAFFRIVPGLENIKRAKVLLTELSNETGNPKATMENARRQDQVREALKFGF
jgi:hypothetical protein